MNNQRVGLFEGLAMLNHFSNLFMPNYTASEVATLIEKHEELSHELAKKIVMLLSQIEKFLIQSSQELSITRNHSWDKKFADSFTSVYQAIKTAEEDCNQNTFNPTQEKIYCDAINYAVTCVRNRVKELHDEHDRLADSYDHLSEEIKSLLVTEYKKNIR